MDASAMIHDIEYLMYRDQTLPDKTSVSNAGIMGNLMRPAYWIKDKIGYNTELNPDMYKALRSIVDNSEDYKGLVQYNLKWSDGKPVRSDTV